MIFHIVTNFSSQVIVYGVNDLTRIFENVTLEIKLQSYRNFEALATETITNIELVSKVTTEKLFE